MKLKEEPEKAGFKLNLQKTKIMAPVRSFHGKQWEKEWKQCETVFSGGSKITADGDYRHESKRRLLLGRKAMTDLGSILKSIDITLPAKVHLVKSMDFPVVLYGCESWTVKKAEHLGRWKFSPPTEHSWKFSSVQSLSRVRLFVTP